MGLEPHKAITQYKHDVWQAEQGLDQNFIFTICQTRDGYIWLGTQRGLVRFDGIRITVFNKDNTKELKDNVVKALLQDQENRLWIGTSEGGLSCLTDGKFKTPYNQSPALKDITTISQDRSGVLWIGTMDSGLTRLEKGVFTTFTTRDGLSANRVRALHQDRKGNLLIATSAGLTIQSPDGRFTPYQGRTDLSDKYMISLHKRKNGELWIGCFDGLYCLKDDHLTYYGAANGLPNPRIKCLLEDRDRNLWAGTEGGGLIRIKGGKIETFSSADGLTNDFIYSLYEDREGSLWIGTLKGSLHRLRDTPVTTYTAKEGLSNDIISGIVEDRDGNLWIGTRRGGVNRLKNGKLNLKLTTREGLLSNTVYFLMEDSAGNLWIGTNAGINRFKAGRLTGYTTRDGLSDNQIISLFEDKQRTIWISSYGNLIQFHESKFIRFTGREEFANKKIKCFYQDREGSLWFGTIGSGLYRLKNGMLTAFTTREGLAHNRVECIYEDENRILYIGTRGGLSQLSGGKFTNFTAKDGLVSSDVLFILEDDPDYLWLGGLVGISRINKKELSELTLGKTGKIHPLHLDESSGLKSSWCFNGIRTRDGRFWIATDKGVAVIDPNNIKENTPPPPVVIEEVKADGESIHMNREKQRLIIPPGKKRIEFYYTGLSFIKPLKVKFKLKLEGYDRDWIDVGNARSTTFTGLSPGKYTFKVIACNSDGVWNREGASLSFYLRPYFYQTAWFYLCVGSVVILAGFSLYRLRVRQLKNRERELSALVEVRTRDLKERTIELETAHHKLQKSKEIIETKNRHIMDSIRYAQKIQQAMLPTKEKMAKELTDYFVIFKPKDIVSGDFYWFDVIENQYFIAVADCTGHGVPGALLSMIGYMMLNEVVEEKRIFDPAQVLSHLHQGFRTVLKQELDLEGNDTFETNDGMDLGLCRIGLDTGQITFAGARHSLLYIKNAELVEIKGNRISIGGRQRGKIRSFTNHLVEIPTGKNEEEELMIYMTTDGFADQHNPGNQKFGTRRLKEFLRDNAHLKALQQQEALVKVLETHQADEEQRDDITVIGIRLHP